MTRGLGRDRQPAYSPDGGQVIFSSNRSGNVDLWILELATGDLRQCTDDAASDWDPAFTPDGEHVLWSSDRGGNMEVWMAALDGTGARQVTADGRSMIVSLTSEQRTLKLVEDLDLVHWR